MRSAIAVLLFSLLLAAVSTGDSLAGENIKRYKIESGIVEYTMTGSQRGTESLYFDKWGLRETKFTKTSITMVGMTKDINSMLIMDMEWLYSIDLDTNTGTKMPNTFFRNLIKASEEKDLTDVGEEMMKKMGGTKTGTEEILGKTCDVWDLPAMKTKTWVWNGISLKIEITMKGVESTTIATSLKENVKISEEKFTVPADVEITETEDLESILKNVFQKKNRDQEKPDQKMTDQEKPDQE